MKSRRSSLESVVGLTASINVIYLLSVVFEATTPVVFGLAALSLSTMVWMAVAILKDPYSTDKTFEEQFYHDRDDIRRNEVT